MPNCSHVIRFDLPKTVHSYLQSRGQAWQNDSQFVVMLERYDSLYLHIIKVLHEEADFLGHCTFCLLKWIYLTIPALLGETQNKGINYMTSSEVSAQWLMQLWPEILIHPLKNHAPLRKQKHILWMLLEHQLVLILAFNTYIFTVKSFLVTSMDYFLCVWSLCTFMGEEFFKSLCLCQYDTLVT